VRGRLPLSGGVLITEPIEDSTAWLIARASAVSTGSPALNPLLAGPGFLDAGAFPEISFRSELLAWVPAGWRAVGRLQVKNAEHDLACYLDLHLGGTRPDGSPRILITSSWVIDSRWVTSQWIPGLGHRIVMMCSSRGGQTGSPRRLRSSRRCHGVDAAASEYPGELPGQIELTA
jgi:hypothetical protein